MVNNKSEAVKNAAKAPEVKETKAAPAKKEPEVNKAEISKETAEKKAEAPAKKTEVSRKGTAKKAEAVKKTTPKKEEAEVTACVFVEYEGRQIAAKELLETAKKDYTNKHKDAVIKTIELYIKPEENAAYYVVNGEGCEEFKVLL